MTRFTWGIVIGVLVLVGVSIGLAVLLPRNAQAPDLATPEGVVQAYALALQRGEASQAWDWLSSSAQGLTTRERFVQRASGLRGSYERARLSTERTRIDGETARVDLVRTYSSSGGFPFFGSDSSSSTSTVNLVRENGNWRISTPPEPYVLDRAP